MCRAVDIDTSFGGSWWRMVTEMDSPFCTYLADQAEVMLSLERTDLSWFDHSQCPRCTFVYNWGLMTRNDAGELPLMSYAMQQNGSSGPQSCSCVMSRLAARTMSLKVTTQRQVAHTVMCYRYALARDRHFDLHSSIPVFTFSNE